MAASNPCCCEPGCRLVTQDFCGAGGEQPTAPWEIFGDNSSGGFVSEEQPCGLILYPATTTARVQAILTGMDVFAGGNPGIKQSFAVQTNNFGGGAGHAAGSVFSIFGWQDATHYMYGSVAFGGVGASAFHSLIKLRIGYRNGASDTILFESDQFDFDLGLGTDFGDQGSVATLCAQPVGDDDGNWRVDFSFAGHQIIGNVPAPFGSNVGVAAGIYSFIIQAYSLDILDDTKNCRCHPPPEYTYDYGYPCQGCGGDIGNTPPFLVVSVEDSGGPGTNDGFFFNLADCSALLRSWSLTRYSPWDELGYCAYRLFDGTRSPIWNFDGGGQASYPDDLFAPGCGLQAALGFTSPPYLSDREAVASFAAGTLEVSYYPLPNGFGPHPLDLVEVQDWCSKTSRPAYVADVAPSFPGGLNTNFALIAEGLVGHTYRQRYRVYAYPRSAGFTTTFPGPSAPIGTIDLWGLQVQIRKTNPSDPNSYAKMELFGWPLATLKVFAPEAQNCLDMDLDTSILTDDDLFSYEGANNDFWCNLKLARGRIHT